LATALSASLALAGAAAAAPESYGTLAVHEAAVRIAVPVDPGGPEGVLPYVNADVYAPVKGGKYPMLELSHAWPGTLAEFPLSGWANRLASRGFVVIVSDRRAGSSLAVNSALDQPVDLIDLSAAVGGEDILRVLRWAIAQNAVAGSFLHGKVDPSRLAIGGHSLGAYMSTFAAVMSQKEGPRLSALVLLDPSDERLGTLTYDSSLAQAPLVRVPTIVLASEESQHPVMCNMDDGYDCTLVAPQEYTALSPTTTKLGLKVPGSVHEDIEDPSTIGTAASLAHLALFERYGMAWLEYWLALDCSAAGYLGGADALHDQAAQKISLFAGATPVIGCAAARERARHRRVHRSPRRRRTGRAPTPAQVVTGSRRRRA
jgi:dienelactone hydrolase